MAERAPAGILAWSKPVMKARWDVFCRVVDNFGDVGVCWRLARVLAQEHELDVRLLIDDCAALARMAPGVDRTCVRQRHAGVTVARWTESLSEASAADVVVEAFGCGLPDSYVAALAARVSPPAWFVLEYLSAEAWVDGAHGLPSPHPQLPLTRRFWFPGFTKATGGLLRERALLPARAAFCGDRAAQSAFWGSLGVAPAIDGERRVSLFCYPHPGLATLFEAWADGDEPIGCVVPEGVAVGTLDAWTGGRVPRPGAPVSRGRLTLHAMPFVAQDVYDRLLWACDFNVVRGEDSFVRAQWAARPFVWHIYAQAEGAHLRKLEAFVDRYTAGLDAGARSAVRRLFGAWNDVSAAFPLETAWLEWAALRRQLEEHGMAWARELAGLPELAAGLVLSAQSAV
jgi:uncharacterized repeat protein (TIGR03837 family)